MLMIMFSEVFVWILIEEGKERETQNSSYVNSFPSSKDLSKHSFPRA